MKNFLLLLVFTLGCTVQLMSQQRLVRTFPPKVAVKNNVPATGFEAPPVTPYQNIPSADYPFSSPNQVEFRSDVEVVIGTTVYDLQTNGSNQNRIQRASDGTFATSWTMGFDSNGFPDRGTGYNTGSEDNWGDEPDARIEETTRTGWPSLNKLADDSDIVINHEASFVLQILKNDSGSWVQTTMPSNTPSGILWPRAATGGPDGNTVHAIAYTAPSAFGGLEYEGLDGHILYYRSLDGGNNWDVIDMVLPGVDSTVYGSMTADAYVIKAKGETVAIGLFMGFGDSKVVVSHDNGETWEEHVFVDFPLDKYRTDDGYTLDDIGGVDPDGPGAGDAATLTDSLAIQTTDSSGEVLIDNDGVIHVWYGEMYVTEASFTDGNTNFYPGWSGVRYWNSNFGAEQPVMIMDIPDLNGNDTLDLVSADFGSFGSSLTSFFSAGVDAENNIFLVFSALAEGEEHYNVEDSQHYRHIFATGSGDGGSTWTPPLDLVREETALEPDLVNFVEGVYPTMYPVVDDNEFHIIYQQDFRPGLVSFGDSDPPETNFIIYLATPKSDICDDMGNCFLTSTEEVIAPEELNVQLFPNPASTSATLQYELAEAANVSVELHNMVGQNLQVLEQAERLIGVQNIEIPLANLAKGVYFVKIRVEDKVATKKLVVQ